jgi:two-component system, NarL family, response regulator DevR
MSKIRIVVVDDHEVVRVGLCESLEAEPDMVVVGDARTGADAVRVAQEHQPDVMLLDVKLEDMDGPDVCRRILTLAPKIAVVMFTGHTQEGLILRSLAAGAKGYVIKDVELAELKQAIRSVRRGHTVLDPKITGSLIARMTRIEPGGPGGQPAATPTAVLSDLEVRIVRQLADGRTIKEIAERVHLSPHTIKDRLAKIRAKVGARSRTGIVVEALKRGLI